MPEANLCLVALGANLPSARGGPRETLEAAVAALAPLGLIPVRRSRWWRTPAHPPGSGPDFVNGALACESALGPDAALAALHVVEDAMGRARPARWAPRVCDLDLIAWNDAVRPDPETLRAWMALGDAAGARTAPETLILPHPRLQERAFALVPLAEVAPDWRHPLTGRTVVEMLDALPEAVRGAPTPLPDPRR
jgi:2-amino-4-hydroxy-6-hydroxymethyldihydropteridine diphosphokinase